MTEALAMTWWPSLTETVGELVAEQSWSQLGKWLALAQPRPEDPERPRLAGWSPARFRDDTRDLERVLEVSALALDVDKGAVPLERIRAAFADRAAFVHSTRRSTPAEPRWRIVCRLSRHVTAEEHRQLWLVERERLAALGIALDVSPKDASRFWYVPCEPAEGSYVFEELDGAPLDVDAALAENSGTSREVPRSGSNTAPRNAYGERALEDACRRVASAANGARNNTLNDQAHGIAQLVAGGVLDEDLARRRLADAATAAGLTTSETAKTIASAFKAGKDKPRTKPERSREEAPGAAPATLATAIGDVLDRWAIEGPVVRQPTGIAPVDSATRGGVAYGDVWVVAGAPDAAKTALVVQMADTWARAGVCVGILAADAASGPDSVVMRLAQRRGYDRTRIEARSADTLMALRRELGALSLVIYGGEMTIEAAAADLAARAKESGRRPGFVIDSIHAATSEREKDPRAPMRDAVAARVRATVALAASQRFAVLATAEMSRATYAAPEDARADQAAGAETRVLDYAPAAKLVARRADDARYSLSIARSKSGGSGTMVYLALDYGRMILSPTDAPPPPPSAEERQVTRERVRTERTRQRDADDDACARQIRAERPKATVRELVAAIRAARSCGGERAQAAELRTREVKS